MFQPCFSVSFLSSIQTEVFVFTPRLVSAYSICQTHSQNFNLSSQPLHIFSRVPKPRSARHPLLLSCIFLNLFMRHAVVNRGPVWRSIMLVTALLKSHFQRLVILWKAEATQKTPAAVTASLKSRRTGYKLGKSTFSISLVHTFVCVSDSQSCEGW